jgi:SAM-dependent methyltransferase
MPPSPSPSDRLQWTVDQLSLKPRSQVLEVGCGHGVAVTLVAERLRSGSVTAIDKSPKMIDATAKRNAAFVEAGRVVLHETTLADATFDRKFDVAFGAHVPVFLRGDPKQERDVLATCLKPKALLFLSSQPLDGDVRRAADEVCQAVESGGFEVIEIVDDELESGPITGIWVRP